MRKFIFCICVLQVLLGCSSDSEVETPPMEEEQDTTAPQITINGINDTLERTTTVTITISDASDIVETTVMLNGNEVFSSNTKEFSFDIDPFDFPNGETTLTVQAIDDSDNEGMASNIFDLRRFLVSIAAPFFGTDSEVFISANSLDGDLLSATNVEIPRNIVRLYAEENIARQNIVVSSYTLNSVFLTFNSIADIEIGTDLVVFQENAGIATVDTFVERPIVSSFNVTVTAVPNTTVAGSFYAAGEGYFGSFPTINPLSAGEFDSELSIGVEENVNELFLYTSDVFNSSGNRGINLDNYRYMFINELTDQSISFADLQAPTETITINIPDNTTSYNSSLLGFSNESDFQNNISRSLLDFFSPSPPNGATTFSTIELPVVNAFDIVMNRIALQLADGRNVNFFNVGIKDVVVPNWEVIRENNENYNRGFWILQSFVVRK